MPLVLEQIHTPGIAQLSYLVGDDSAKIAAVIDPRRDVAVYLEMARQRGLRIAFAIETHVHADFVSGARELASRTGARILVGPSEAYGFDVQQLEEGEVVELGSVSLRAIHTPGHTPEHLSFLLTSTSQGSEPFAVFTGDTLLNLSVGRPDLVGVDVEEQLARQLHGSLFDRLLPLGDGMEVLPGHTAGSACALSIGDRLRTTAGAERLANPYLAEPEEDVFVRRLLGELPEPPRFYARLKEVNAAGRTLAGGASDPEPLAASEFHRRSRTSDSLVLDIRRMLGFGGGHIPGALNIGLDRKFPTWVGWMVPADATLLLVADSVAEVDEAVLHLFRLGYDRISGYLHPGMKAWQDGGLPLERLAQWTVLELDRHREDPDVTVLDVRSDREYAEGHVPGAEHIYLPHLEERVSELDSDCTIAVYCGSGYRSSIAASVLQRSGFRSVINVPGSFSAWKAVGFPVETESGAVVRGA